MLLVVLFLLRDADGHLPKRRTERSRQRRDTAAARSWFTGGNAIDKTAKHVGHLGRPGRLRRIRYHFDQTIFQHHVRSEVFHSQIELSRLFDCFLRDETDDFTAGNADIVLCGFRTHRFKHEMQRCLLEIGQVH